MAISLALALLVSLGLQAGADLAMARRARGLEGTALLGAAQVATVAGDAAIYLVVTAVAALALALVRRYRPLGPVALYLFACIALSGLSADVIKIVVARARPILWFSQGIYGYHGFRLAHDWNSFPSGHATTLGALSAALAGLAPRARTPLFAAAALLALTRVLILEHWLSDVVMGFAWGVASVAVLDAWLDRHFGGRVRTRFASGNRGMP